MSGNFFLIYLIQQAILKLYTGCQRKNNDRGSPRYLEVYPYPKEIRDWQRQDESVEARSRQRLAKKKAQIKPFANPLLIVLSKTKALFFNHTITKVNSQNIP